MVKIQNHNKQTIKADFVRRGTSSRGPWELVKVKDSNHKHEITIWPDNAPSGIEEGDWFEVEDISEVRFGPRKNERTGEWRQDCSISATLRRVDGPDVPSVPDFDAAVEKGIKPNSGFNPYSSSIDDFPAGKQDSVFKDEGEDPYGLPF